MNYKQRNLDGSPSHYIDLERNTVTRADGSQVPFDGRFTIDPERNVIDGSGNKVGYWSEMNDHVYAPAGDALCILEDD